MEKIILAKGEGKTTKLVELVKKDRQGVLVVNSFTEKTRLMREYELQNDQIIIWHDLNSTYYISNDKSYYIDNVDLILNSLFNFNLKAISLTKES